VVAVVCEEAGYIALELSVCLILSHNSNAMKTSSKTSKSNRDGRVFMPAQIPTFRRACRARRGELLSKTKSRPPQGWAASRLIAAYETALK
jgi:hypothetical protein